MTWIEDSDLPAGHDWVMLEVDGEVHFMVKRGKLSVGVMEQGRAAYWQLTGERLKTVS